MTGVETVLPPVRPPSSSVSNVTFCGFLVWLETSRTIGPAPVLAGETWITSSWTAAVSVTGAAGRGGVRRGSPRPHAVASSAAVVVAAAAAAAIRTAADGTARSPALRPVRGGCWAVRARAAPRLRRVPRRRHGDQRAARRAVRADRGRRGAGGGGRAARRVGVPGRRRRAAVARDPAPHGHLAGDDRRGAAGLGGPAGARVPHAWARPGRALGLVRPARPGAGVRARGAGVAGPSGALHGPARAPLRAAAAQ